MIIKRALQRHLIHSFRLRDKTKQLGGHKLKAIHFFQRDAEKLLEIGGIDPRAVRGPKQIIDHALAE